MQKEFMGIHECQKSLQASLEYINEASEMFRNAQKPVIVIQDEEAGQGPGSEGFELIDQLNIVEGDHKVQKLFSNAFWKTDLESLLKKLEVKFLVISGFAVEHCVLFTLNGALEREFGASLLQHGVAGFDESIIKQIQSLRPVVSLETLYYILNEQ